MTDAPESFGLYDWRNAVASPVGPSNPSTRLVLLTLSLYMDPRGFAWPSQTTLAARSGLSLRTVKGSVDDAEKAKWIVRSWQARNGQGWRLTRYQGTFPANIDRASKPWELDSAWKRGAAVAPPSGPSKPDVVQTVRNVVQPTTEGGANSARNVVQQLHTNSSSELLKNSSSEGPTLTRQPDLSKDLKSKKPEAGRQPRPTTAKPNGSNSSTFLWEVFREREPEPPKRRQLAAADGLKLIDALIGQGDGPVSALQEANRQGYAVTAEELHEHLRSKGECVTHGDDIGAAQSLPASNVLPRTQRVP